jgi:hypothetical protein
MTLEALALSRANETLLVKFPDALWFNGVEYGCIAPPVELLKKMQLNMYDANAMAQFQMRESDRATAGISSLARSVITYKHPTLGEFAFEVTDMFTDKNDTMIRLVCNLKQ